MKTPTKTKNGHLTAAALKDGFIEHVGYVYRPRSGYKPTVEIWHDGTQYVINRIGARTQWETKRKDVALQTAKALV